MTICGILYYFGPILWIARRLKFVPLSASEQEIGAMVVILKDAISVINVGQDMGLKLTKHLRPQHPRTRSGRGAAGFREVRGTSAVIYGTSRVSGCDPRPRA